MTQMPHHLQRLSIDYVVRNAQSLPGVSMPMAVEDKTGHVHTDGQESSYADEAQIPQLKAYVTDYLGGEGQHLQDYMGTQVNLDGIGSDYLGESTVAAILKGARPSGDEFTIFLGNRDFDGKVQNLQRMYGLQSEDEARTYVLSHEMVHAMGVESEVEVEQILTRYFTERAEEYTSKAKEATDDEQKTQLLSRAGSYERMVGVAQYRSHLDEDELRGENERREQRETEEQGLDTMVDVCND